MKALFIIVRPVAQPEHLARGPRGQAVSGRFVFHVCMVDPFNCFFYTNPLEIGNFDFVKKVMKIF